MIASSEPTLPLPPRTKVKRYLFLLVVLGFSLYFLLPEVSRIQHALQVASTLRIQFIALALSAQALSYLGSGYLLRVVVGPLAEPLSVVDGALVTAGANSIGTLGGGVLGTAGMTYRWLRQRGAGPGASGLGGWIPIFLNDATLALVSLTGLLALILLGKFSSIVVLGLSLAFLILGGGIGMFLWCVTHRESMTPVAMAIARFTTRFRRIAVNPEEIQLAVGRLLQAWDTLVEAGWMAPATGAALNTGFDMLTLAFLFLSAGYDIGPLVLVAGYGLPQLLGKLTVILGGIGVVETTMVGLYSIFGVPTAISVVVILVYRLFSFWIPTLVGIALVPYFEHQKV